MTTKIIEDFILIVPYMETEEVPAPGTSPEAPGGPAYEGPDTDDTVPGDLPIEDQPDIYQFPEDPDRDDSLV